MPVKGGRLNNGEKSYITSNANSMSPKQIAERLNRSEKQVLSELARLTGKGGASSTFCLEVQSRLKNSSIWKNLKAELDELELEFFEEQYAALMEQFKEEQVLPTEENQVIKVIKLDILKHRNARRQKRLQHEIERCEKVHEKIIKSKPYSKLDKEEMDALSLLEQSIQSLYAQQSSMSTEYVKFEEKHQKLMEALKATREQRVDRIQSSKVDFLGLLRSLGEETVRDENERYIEIMRRAVSNETKKLSEIHIFGDGIPDQPLLNSNSVNMDNK